MKNLYFVLLMALMPWGMFLPAQCIINTGNTTPGITAVNASDTLTEGSLYAQTFQIYIPATYQGIAIDSVHLAISGEPSGLYVLYLPEDGSGETIAGGAQGVICLSGITYDGVGAYPLSFTGNMYTGGTTTPLSSLGADFNYTFYVKAPGPTGYACDTVMNLNPAYDDTIVIPLDSPNNGYLSGNGAVNFGGTYYTFKAVAEKLIGGVGDSVTGATIEFGRVTINSGDSGMLVGIYVYDDDGPLGTGALAGGPGDVLDSAFLTLRTIAHDVQNGVFSTVAFLHGTKLTLPEFFIVVQLPQTTGDTVAVYTNNTATTNGAGYLNFSVWYSYSALFGLSSDSLGNFIGATVCGNEPEAPGPGFDALPASVCVGTTVNFNNVTLGSPSSFSWSFGDGTTGSTLLNPTHVYTDTGSYLVSLTAANPGGIVTFSHYLKVHGNPSASGEITNATGLTATDGAVVITVTGGTAPYTFLWSTGGNHDTLSAVAPGTYEVTVTDTNSCVVAETFVVSYSNNVRDLSDDVQLKIYPNPANDVLFVQSGNSAIIKLEVVNVMGQTVLVNNGSGNFYRLQTHVLAPGNYLLLVHTDGGVARRMFTVVRE